MYTLVNAGPSLRVIKSPLGDVVLPPRSKTQSPVVLSDGTAKLIRRGQLRGSKLSISSDEAREQAILLGCHDIKRRFNIVPPTQDDVAKLMLDQRLSENQIDRDEILEAEARVSEAPVAAKVDNARANRIQQLIETADRLTPPQLRGEARKVLGAAYPGGNLGRRAIEALLEKALNDGVRAA